MIISANSKALQSEFDCLLNLTVAELNARAAKTPRSIAKLTGQKLEPVVGKIMMSLAVGTPFEGTIEIVGGQKFPDIVALQYFGIEVKTTTKDHWKTTGNSVLESTRIQDVQRIYMLFGKLGGKIQFRSRLYEECLAEVVVTHSPRYLIDMDLPIGNTIFDKLHIPYDNLRSRKNPIKPITAYYKSQLKQGQDIWWIQDTDSANNLIIKTWNSLSPKEHNKLKAKVMVFFPEIFGKKQDKFNNAAIWLVKSEAIVCPNIRDSFSAGGRTDLQLAGLQELAVPRIVSNLYSAVDEIATTIFQESASNLSAIWSVKTTQKRKMKDWIKLVSFHMQDIYRPSNFSVHGMLVHMFREHL